MPAGHGLRLRTWDLSLDHSEEGSDLTGLPTKACPTSSTMGARVWNVIKHAIGVEVNKKTARGTQTRLMVEGAMLETVTPIMYHVVNDLQGY
ncbi:hypothetical protein Pfo_029616 [Paulownia fortunei]|nr:hypothetical protein Pfo_029616 [Paulownia fortunei]